MVNKRWFKFYILIILRKVFRIDLTKYNTKYKFKFYIYSILRNIHNWL